MLLGGSTYAGTLTRPDAFHVDYAFLKSFLRAFFKPLIALSSSTLTLVSPASQGGGMVRTVHPALAGCTLPFRLVSLCPGLAIAAQISRPMLSQLARVTAKLQLFLPPYLLSSRSLLRRTSFVSLVSVCGSGRTPQWLSTSGISNLHPRPCSLISVLSLTSKLCTTSVYIFTTSKVLSIPQQTQSHAHSGVVFAPFSHPRRLNLCRCPWAFGYSCRGQQISDNGLGRERLDSGL